MTPVIEEARGSGAIGPTEAWTRLRSLRLGWLGRRVFQQATAVLAVERVQL